MATILESSLLDLSILEGMSAFFLVILVFVMTYALLQKTEILGGNQGLDALVAISVSVLLLLSPDVVEIIGRMTPIITLLLFAMMFFLITTRFMGVPDDSIVKMFGGRNAGMWPLIIGILIFLGVAGSVVGPILAGNAGDGDAIQPGEPGEVGTGDFNTDVTNTIFHPTFLGFIVLMLIASFTVRAMVKGRA